MSVYIAAAFFIFLAALPGRTTFVMMIMASRGKARDVILGAAPAFLLQALISVALGGVLKLLPQSVVHGAIALLFFYFSWKFWKESGRAESAGERPTTWYSVFALVFLAEWGDVSQIAIASYASMHPSYTVVFLSAVSALWATIAVALVAGKFLGAVAPKRLIQKAAACAFFLLGVYFLCRALR